MIRIAIPQAAFEAIAKTLLLGSVGYENAVNENGERLIWLERRMLDKLNSYRRAGESYSDGLARAKQTFGLKQQEARQPGRAPRSVKADRIGHTHALDSLRPGRRQARALRPPR
jgi:hypothetical protein